MGSIEDAKTTTPTTATITPFATSSSDLIEVEPTPTRRIFVDIIALEAEYIPSAAAAPQTLFFKLALGKQEYTSTLAEKDLHPVYNEDCTFTLSLPFYDDSPSSPSANPEEETLFLTVWERVSGLLSTYDVTRGQSSIDLSSLEFDTIYDTWIPCTLPYATAPQTQLHLIISKIEHSQGMLSHFGKPLSAIPIRAEVGDLFVMSSTLTWARVSKFATWSEWDHVGIVVRATGKRGLRLLEATAEGVVVYNLNSSITNYRIHAKVAFRRLKVHRTPEIMDSFLEFVEEMRGKPYNSSLLQMWRAARGGKNTEADLTAVFCSQLTAAAYQKVGVISPDDPANNFLPFDFASSARGKLLHDLGKLIVFPMAPEELEKEVSSPPAVLPALILQGINIVGTVIGSHTSRKYTMYQVEVTTKEKGKYITLRSYRDFCALDKLLRKHFTPPYSSSTHSSDPHPPSPSPSLSSFPVLPEKDIDSMSELAMTERRKRLLIYLGVVLRDPILSRVSFVFDFLNKGNAFEKVVAREEEKERAKEEEEEEEARRKQGEEQGQKEKLVEKKEKKEKTAEQQASTEKKEKKLKKKRKDSHAEGKVSPPKEGERGGVQHKHRKHHQTSSSSSSSPASSPMMKEKEIRSTEGVEIVGPKSMNSFRKAFRKQHQHQHTEEKLSTENREKKGKKKERNKRTPEIATTQLHKEKEKEKEKEKDEKRTSTKENYTEKSQEGTLGLEVENEHKENDAKKEVSPMKGGEGEGEGEEEGKIRT